MVVQYSHEKELEGVGSIDNESKYFRFISYFINDQLGKSGKFEEYHAKNGKPGIASKSEGDLPVAPIPTPRQFEKFGKDKFQLTNIFEDGIVKGLIFADVSEQIAKHCGDMPIEHIEQKDDKTTQIARQLIFLVTGGIDLPPKGLVRINASRIMPARVALVGNGVPQSLTSLTKANFPSESVIPREDLIKNMQVGFNELGIECTTDDLEKLTPKEIGLATLLALSADVNFLYDDQSNLLIKVSSEDRIPGSLAFRHIGPGLRVIGSAVLEYELVKRVLSDQLIGLVDLPFENDKALAMSVISGKFKQILQEGLEKVLPLEQYKSLIQAKSELVPRDLELYKVSLALESIRALIKSKPVEEDPMVVEKRRVVRDERIGKLNYSFRQGLDKENYDATVEELEKLRLEQELDIPIDYKSRLLAIISPLFDQANWESTKRILSADNPSKDADSRPIITRMHTLFGAEFAEELMACIHSKTLPSLQEVDTSRDENSLLLDACEEKLKRIRESSPKITLREKMNFLLELLSYSPK